MSTTTPPTLLHHQFHRRLLHMAGILPHPATSVGKSVTLRLPWIGIGIAGGFVAARTITSFETLLNQHFILAAFIPLIVYISDAIGTQTQTLFIRDISLNPQLKLLPYAATQTLTTTILGSICSSITTLGLILFNIQTTVAITIGIAMFASIVSSTIIALIIPWALQSLRQDPAIGSGPFATMLQDLTSIYIYFIIATNLL